jgi:hypothetical protein
VRVLPSPRTLPLRSLPPRTRICLSLDSSPKRSRCPSSPPPLHHPSHSGPQFLLRNTCSNAGDGRRRAATTSGPSSRHPTPKPHAPPPPPPPPDRPTVTGGAGSPPLQTLMKCGGSIVQVDVEGQSVFLADAGNTHSATAKTRRFPRPSRLASGSPVHRDPSGSPYLLVSELWQFAQQVTSHVTPA